MIKTKKNYGKNEKFKFEIGEKVLCYQGSHIYEAKCLSIRKSSTVIEYLIHYRGWKPKYDEWVHPDRILKFNQDNIQLQQRLRQNSKEKFKKINKEKKHLGSTKDEKKLLKKEKLKKSDSLDSTSTTTNNSVNHNYKNLNTKDIEVPVFIEKQEDFLNKHEVKIRIPEDLKTILTDDWELIINQKKLVHLPFKLNIDKILNDYFFNKSQSSKLPLNHTIDGYIDFLSGIRRYFNYFLDKCLLYPTERQQMEYLVKNYDEFTLVLKTNPDPSNKDSKRLWKKFKRSSSKGVSNKLSSSSILSNEIENDAAKNTTAKSKLPLFMDQNSQSETSDSCSTSTEVSATEFNNTQNKIINKNDNPSDKRIDFTKLYGAVHLLRLFTKLGRFLFYSNLSSDRLALLNSYIYDFLKYLSKNLWLFANESDTSYVDACLFVNK